MAYITIKNLKKEYQVTRTEKQQVLKGIDVEFDRGEFVALLGESGCGKTTFLNILAGLDFNYTGSIVIKKKFISDFNERDLDNYRRNQVGIIFQNFNLVSNLTAFENVMLPLSLTTLTQEERVARANELLAEVGLTEHSMKRPNQLSGGQKQRVAIARALANNPSIVVADEPTGNLDEQSSAEVLEILKKIATGGKLVICVTHSQKVASNCTRVLHMSEGVIAEDNNTKNYKTKFKEEVKPTKVKDNIDKKEIYNFAKNNLRQNMKRSILVTGALSIGIFAFVLMFFLGNGMRMHVENELTTTFNRHQINVMANQGGVGAVNQNRLNFAVNERGRIVPAGAINNFNVTYQNARNQTEQIFQVLTFYDDFQSNWVSGFQPTREQLSATTGNGIIISSRMMWQLASENADGELEFDPSTTITLTHTPSGRTQDFNIIGVTDDTEGFDTAFISHGANRNLANRNYDNMVYVIANRVTAINSIMADLTESGLFAYQPDNLATEVMNYIDTGIMLLTIVSFISLVVSAIMITIVMYISVLERTKEIGILRSVGTRRRDIKRIFITEAGMIGLAAGVIGTVLAIVVGLFTNLAAGSTVMGVWSWHIILGLGVSFLVSILASLAPSGNAAGLDPIEALRSNE